MIASIAVSLPIVRVFSYSVNEVFQPFIKRYQRVKVPFHNKVVTGFVEDIEENTIHGLKEIYELTDIYPLLDNGMISLCRWSSDHYITPLGLVFKYAIPRYIQPERYLILDIKKDGGHIEDTRQLGGKTLEAACNQIGRHKIFKYLDDGIITLRDVFTKNKYTCFDEKPDRQEKKLKKLYS